MTVKRRPDLTHHEDEFGYQGNAHISNGDISDRITDAISHLKTPGRRAFDLVMVLLSDEMWRCVEEGRRMRREKEPEPRSDLGPWSKARCLGWRFEDVTISNAEALQGFDAAVQRAVRERQGAIVVEAVSVKPKKRKRK